MADVKEYIVRIKGDTSQLEAAANRAQAKFKQLSDTEVRLKVNFGKNNADIKSLLDEVKKVDPEVHTKMVIDGLDDLKQAEDRLEQIKKIEKDMGSKDSMFKTLSKYSKEFNEAEKEAGETLDDSKTIGILKEALNYIESIGKAADDVSIQPFVKGLRQAAEDYEDQLKGFKPENLLAQKDTLQNRLSSLSKNIGDIPEQDQIEARISKYIDELYGIEDRIDARLESDSSNLIKKLKEASDYLDQIEKKYGKIEGSDLVDELKQIRNERASELNSLIFQNSKTEKKEKVVKNKEVEKKDEPVDDDTFDSWLDEIDRIDQEVKKTEKLTEARKEAVNASKEEAPYESHVDEIKEETKSLEELSKAREEARDEAHDSYQRQLDEEAQELAEKKAREEEYRREQEEAAREAAEEERRIAEEQAQCEAEIEEESRRYAEKQMEEYERQVLERIELEKKVRDANEQALKEQESQYSPVQDYDVFADQYAEETEGERQLASAINERAEATEKAALSQKNLESQNVVDNIIKQQEAIKKYNQELYESKGMMPTTDDYDSYYNSDGVGRYIEQTREAREETERLNEVAREGFVQDDSIVEQTENLNKNTEAVKKNADANKEASDKKDKIKAEGLSLDKQASLQRLDALEQKLKEVGIASKELEDGFANTKKAIADATDTSELANANKRIRNLATEVNAKVKRRQVEVDYSSELSALGKLKTEIVESSEASSELKAKAKDMFEAFSNSESFAESNVNKLKSAIKDLNSEFKESKKEFATRNTKANTRMSGYIDRLNSYNPDKYTAEVRKKMADLRDELTKLPRDAEGNFKIDLNDEDVAKQVAKIDAAMNDLKESVRSADGVLANGISVKKLNQQMAQFVDKNHRLTDEYKQDIKELREALNDDGLTKSGYMDVLGKFKDVQAQAADEGLVGGIGNLENLGNQIKRMSTNFVAQYFSLYDIVRYARELGQTVTEINSAQTELRKVSDASQTRIQENFKTSAETAQEMGATISDVIKSTSDWARLGYSVDDAETLARNTTLFQTVGDNLTQESASEYMTSIMKGYQYDADQSESIIDKVNEVNLAARLYRNLQIRIGCGLILSLIIYPQIAGTPQSQSA